MSISKILYGKNKNMKKVEEEDYGKRKMSKIINKKAYKPSPITKVVTIEIKLMLDSVSGTWHKPEDFMNWVCDTHNYVQSAELKED